MPPIVFSQVQSVKYGCQCQTLYLVYDIYKRQSNRQLTNYYTTSANSTHKLLGLALIAIRVKISSKLNAVSNCSMNVPDLCNPAV